jgi:AraC family ethanolamine operon transcriptional activator
MQAGHYRDFDEFVASVQGVDCRMTLQNAARHVWDIEAADLPGTRVQLGRLGSGNIVEGQSLADTYLIYLPLSDTCEYVLNGMVIEKNAFGIMEPGSECCLSTKFEHDWCTIFVPADELDCHSGSEERRTASGPMICRTTRPNPVLADRFRASVLGILTTASSRTGFEHSLAAELASAHLMELCSTIIGCEQEREIHHAGRPKLPRREIIRRAEGVLEERDHVSVHELATAAHVPERTLRKAFNEFFGVSPTRYLQLRKLHAIYRALRKAEPDETSVSQVLIAHGEWEFGRVAGRYRQLFGELPSETLQRRPPKLLGNSVPLRHAG